MKIIDLLNKIANEEEVPKKIKYKISVWEYDNDMKDYYWEDYENTYWLTSGYHRLNDEVVIIEEPKKVDTPKHIPKEVIQDFDKAICPANVKCIAHKVNEIICYLQHIRKSDNNES